MYLLGIDLGTSSIKVSVLDAGTQRCIASAQYPDHETPIIASKPGWAEQHPDEWWDHIQQAILKCHASGTYDPKAIAAIGIAYQMHGLVLVDKQQQVLRPAIIWCDSRAVPYGERAFQALGEQYCLEHLLNSPGNFTAAKLAWVKENEPEIYDQIDKILLPGDFVSLRLTGHATTSVAALSEGICWDFKEQQLSSRLLDFFGFDTALFPEIRELFSSHGQLSTEIAQQLSLREGIPVSYKSGDQPNNALALNVLEPGEVASTAGTSGVIYGVADKLCYDQQSRINSFAHVNHTAPGSPGEALTRIGVLLCINGVGIFNRWIRDLAGDGKSYAQLNEAAAAVATGADGLIALPFGNGAERMLNNRQVGAHFQQLDFNKHTTAHMVRAVQEGIVYSFRYGLDIMRSNGIQPAVVRASKANLFLSPLFTQLFTSVNQVALEFYEGDGSTGAAIGAGIGAGIYASAADAANRRKPVGVIEPGKDMEAGYAEWKTWLERVSS